MTASEFRKEYEEYVKLQAEAIIRNGWVVWNPFHTDEVCQHKFPNTGLHKSWCKHCGHEAQFNWKTGTYE